MTFSLSSTRRVRPHRAAHRPSRSLACAIGLLCGTIPAGFADAADVIVGTMVSASGAARAPEGRPGTWEPAVAGTPVHLADHIQTAAGGTASILFRDDTVATLGPSTRISVESLTVEITGEQSRYIGILRLAGGRLRAQVDDERYTRPRSRFEIETPSAVASVRGTELIVDYDPDSSLTEVVALSGRVEVQGTISLIGPGATLSAGERSRVTKSRFPSPPDALDAATRQRYTDMLRLTGTGQHDGVDVGHPATTGRVLRPEDLPLLLDPETGGRESAGAIEPAPPGSTLGNRLSDDVRVHEQPPLEFRAAPPGQSPSGQIDIDF